MRLIRIRAAVAVLVMLGGVGSALAQLTVPGEITSMINPACADFQIEGPCSCTGIQVDQVCVLVSYHVPMYIVETILRPNDTVVGDGSVGGGFGGLEEILSAGGSTDVKPSSRGRLTFRDARVYAAPITGVYGCNACPSTESALILLYDSTEDQRLWRIQPDFILPFASPLHALNGAGAWGFLFPRTGHSRGNSQPVASALAAWRALSILFVPTVIGGGTHTIQGVPTNVSSTTGIPTCFQAGYPTLSRCGPVGMNPLHWADELIEPQGRNVFVLWGTKSCCVDPGVAACGQGFGAQATDQFCRIPFDPFFAVVPGMPFDIPFDGK